MKLYHHEISSNSRKVCALAKHLDLDVDYVLVDLTKGVHRTPEFLTINPNGKLPTMVDAGRTLWESNAILCYLAKKAGSDLWPADDEQKIDVIKWLNWEQAHFTRHAGTLFFETFIKNALNLGDTDQDAVKEASGFLHQFATVLDTHLSSRDYLVGKGLTVADFAVGVVIPLAADAQEPLDGYSGIARWYEKLNALPAWREPWPANSESLAA